MEEADLKERYLESVLVFKSAKELNDQFMTAQELGVFLKELTLSLDFNEEIFTQAKSAARQSFEVYLQIREAFLETYPPDEQLKSSVKKHLIQAVNLDPFNSLYLSHFVKENKEHWTASEDFVLRLAELIDPNSAEYVKFEIEQDFDSALITYDYFNSQTLGPYIDALIFLNLEVKETAGFSSKEQLQNLAKSGGVDHKTLKAIDVEVKQMLNIVEDTLDNHWLKWKELLTAYKMVDKMVDLAPYHPNVLAAAIKFKGDVMWRVAFGQLKIKDETLNDKKQFFRELNLSMNFGFQKKLEFALRSFKEAEELAQRFLALPIELFELQNQDFKSKLIRGEIKVSQVRFRQENNPNSISTYINGQRELFKIHSKKHNFKKKNKLLMIYFGIIVGAVYCYLMYQFTQSVDAILNFGIIPIILVVGIGHLRQKWWERRTI